MCLCRLLAAPIVAGFLVAGIGSAQEWPRFRGPNGGGLGNAKAIPLRFTDQDYLWKIKLPGRGHSSPVLWGDRLFVTCGEAKTGKRIVLCVRGHDGHILWSRSFAGALYRQNQDSSFASATPAADDRHVYLSWGSPKDYLVVALNHDGQEVWRTDLGPFKASHGFGVSPIVCEEILVIPNEQDGTSSLVGLDKNTGKVRWQVPRRSRSTYATPCLFQPPGQAGQLIFTNYEHGFTSLDPKTGKKNWELDVFDKGHLQSAIGSPIAAGELVIGVSGWLGVRQEVVAVRPDPQGGQAKVAYRIDRSGVLCTTPLVWQDLLFIWNDRGIVTCAKAKTGETCWRERVPGSFYGSPVCVGEHLYGMSREGDVIVVAASEKFKLISQNSLGEGSHSTPAIGQRRMYLRTFSHLLAIGDKEKP